MPRGTTRRRGGSTGRVLAIFERLGDQGGRAITLHALGNIAYAQGDYAEARRQYGGGWRSSSGWGTRAGAPAPCTSWG